jgi:hypothetical protein
MSLEALASGWIRRSRSVSELPRRHQSPNALQCLLHCMADIEGHKVRSDDSHAILDYRIHSQLRAAKKRRGECVHCSFCHGSTVRPLLCLHEAMCDAFRPRSTLAALG